MSNVITLPPRNAPSVFTQNRSALPDMNNAAQQGVQAGFAVVGYKGRIWSIKHGGETTQVVDPKTGAPVPTLDVVVVGVSPYVSKLYYEKRYSEGDAEAPDCWSTNGVKPDEAATKKQHATCAACPMNVFGSRISEAGKKVKACQDSRRIAVVPSGDLGNDLYGGVMLLRIPPMSLNNFAQYGKELTRYGSQPYEVRTTLGFDYSVAYPLITFKPSGWIENDADAKTVLEWVTDDQTGRVISYSDDVVAEVGAPEPQAEPVSPLAAPRPAVFQAAPAPTPVVTQAAPPPLPVPVVAAPPPLPTPPPLPPAEEPYQLSPDGTLRWRPGMAAWEPVPAVTAGPVAAPARTRGRPAKAPEAAPVAQVAAGAPVASTVAQEATDEPQLIQGTQVIQTPEDIENAVDALLA